MLSKDYSIIFEETYYLKFTVFPLLVHICT